jgi:predicted metal-binding protein
MPTRSWSLIPFCCLLVRFRTCTTCPSARERTAARRTTRGRGAATAIFFANYTYVTRGQVCRWRTAAKMFHGLLFSLLSKMQNSPWSTTTTSKLLRDEAATAPRQVSEWMEGTLLTWLTTPVSCCIHSDGIWNRAYRLVAASRTRARLYTPCCNLQMRSTCI